MEKERKDKKKEKKDKKKRKRSDDSEPSKKSKRKERSSDGTTTTTTTTQRLSFPHQYILAPMVGASELAFRLLCRQYGAQLAYTPMMDAHKFAHDKDYRAQEFQTCEADHPLVCHFCANKPEDFAAAAQVAATRYHCDAIDLNLGCPQRTAYLGHFGSYLLDESDRDLVCSMVRAACKAVDIPIFCKIRLLDTLEDTIKLCEQLQEAGAALVAVHARYRASWERKGPGARDGPALLDQVAEIKKHLRIPVIANGNTITFDDCIENLELTKADGIMSAEGILDNPALFLPRLGNPEDTKTRVPLLLPGVLGGAKHSTDNSDSSKQQRKLSKKLREICRLEEKAKQEGNETLSEEEKMKLSKKASIEIELNSLQEKSSSSAAPVVSTETKDVALSDLYEAAGNKLKLANEYLDLATRFPVKIRSIVFHTRRILKDELTQYQLMEACLAAENIEEVRNVLRKIQGYQKNPMTFTFDKEKERAQKEALERKRQEEGKRKSFEARMMRKAKREGRQDLQFYLHQGAEVPSVALVQKLKKLPRLEALPVWKEKHSQHCLAYHLDGDGCKRGRTCAFLHVDLQTANNFNEQDEVAG